jgi:hypothetical protein
MLKLSLDDPQSMSSKTLSLVAKFIDEMAANRVLEEEHLRELFKPKDGEDNPFAEQLAADKRQAVAAYGVDAHVVEDAEIINFPEPDATNVFAPPVVPQPYGIERDSAGNPWDGRIHASSRALVADGTWRMKRGVADDLVAQVMGELAQTVAAPTPLAGVPMPPLPFAPEPSAVPPPPVTQSIPASPISSGPTFIEFVKMVTAAHAAKTTTQEQINAACNAVGIPSMPMLMQRPELIPQVCTILGFAA